jgi:hypothetical protein
MTVDEFMSRASSRELMEWLIIFKSELKPKENQREKLRTAFFHRIKKNGTITR